MRPFPCIVSVQSAASDSRLGSPHGVDDCPTGEHDAGHDNGHEPAPRLVKGGAGGHVGERDLGEHDRSTDDQYDNGHPPPL